jgi:NADH:ubiquinone oxidoreductase subunit E
LTQAGLRELVRYMGEDSRHNSLMRALEEMQDRFRYLPQEGMILLSEYLGIPLSQIYSVATFYHAFSLVPRGVHTIQICTGTACHVRCAMNLLNHIESRLGISPGETSEDGLFTLETGNCLGACALGPVVMLDGEYEGKMTPKRLDRITKRVSR